MNRSADMPPLASKLRVIGPGLLWAGTAVGVSHLVQSTRAGAGFGMSLLWVVLLANFLKYPAFEAGARYPAATGRSLAEAYRQQGRWALVLFGVLTIVGMFAIEAAVTIVTAGLAGALISDAISTTGWAALLLATCGAVLAMGQYRWLDRAMKTLIGLLTVSTLIAVAAVFPSLFREEMAWAPAFPIDQIGFLVALAGWMPSAFDTAVWQSLWSLENAKAQERVLTTKDALLDFRVGYFGTVLLALLFLSLGAAVLYGYRGEAPTTPVAFANHLADVYEMALGKWARPFLLVAAFATMLSTTLSVSDGFPRAVEALVARWRGPEEPGRRDDHRVYWGALAVMSMGAVGIIAWFQSNLRGLVDLATTLSFATAPVLAWLNYRAVQSDEVPEDQRLTPAWKAYHLVGIAGLTAFSLAWAAWKLS